MSHILDTASGRRVDLDSPSAGQIALEDIAHALSRIRRFGAHTLHFYSVAQHAVYVSELVEQRGRPALALLALHHDSHEAYAGDLPSPVKRYIRGPDQKSSYEVLCDALDRAIGAKLGVELPASGTDERFVKEADRTALVIEARELIHDRGDALIAELDAMPRWVDGAPPLGTGLSSEEAKSMFLLRHKSLTT